MIKKLIVAVALFFPAMAFSQTYPLISIHDLQYVDDQNLSNGLDSALAYIGDTVQVEGVVIFDPCAYGQSTTGSRVATFLSDVNSAGAWNGIQIIADPAVIGAGSGPAALLQLSNSSLFQDNCVLGNTVKVTGILSSFSTTLSSSTASQPPLDTPLNAAPLLLLELQLLTYLPPACNFLRSFTPRLKTPKVCLSHIAHFVFFLLLVVAQSEQK